MSITKIRTVYLSGCKSDRNILFLPLPSAAVLFLLHYCDCNAFEVVFVNERLDRDCCVQMSFSVLLAVKYRFIQLSDSPHDCDLPGIREDNDIRSGLCSTLRHIVAVSHDENLGQNLQDLLGFRKGSLKACAEDSGWTKLCEIEIPVSVSGLLQQIRRLPRAGQSSALELPENVMKLEWHFSKPPLVHNDDKHKRALLTQMKQEVLNLTHASEFQFQRNIQKTHCVIRYQIKKPNHIKENSPSEKSSEQDKISASETPEVNKFENSRNSLKKDSDTADEQDSSLDMNEGCSIEGLRHLVGNLTMDSIEFVHLYAEGMELTLSDLILLTYFYFLLQSVSFDTRGLESHIPSIMKWYRHMLTLPRVQQTAKKCQFELDGGNNHEMSPNMCRIKFQISEDVRSPEDDEMELSRRCRAKYRAIKPDVTRALAKIKIKPSKISKVKRRLYSPTALANAYQAVREQGIAVRKASRLYNVPLTTLRDRIDGRISVDVTSSGPDPLLSLDEESQLVEHLMSLCDLGYGYTRAQVCELGADLAVFVNKKVYNKPLSTTWFYKFMSRWPEIHVSKPRGLSAIRAKSASPDAVSAYYNELETILKKYNLTDSPESIYNIEEKVINTEHTPLSGNDSSVQSITCPPCGGTTTVLGCGNVIGQQIPPYFVFAGKREVENLMDGAIPGGKFAVSETGWSNLEIFEDYMKTHLSRYVQCNDGQKVIVFYDGHTSHIGLSIISWARKRGIILFLFPPHCSQILQPIDVGCFGSLQEIYNRECLSFLRENPGQTISRLNVCKLACKAYSQALSPDNLRALFLKAGIYPLNKAAKPERKLKPSSLCKDKSQTEDMQDPIYKNETQGKGTGQDLFQQKDSKCTIKDVTEKTNKRKMFHNQIGSKAFIEIETTDIITNHSNEQQQKLEKKTQKRKAVKRKQNQPGGESIKEKKVTGLQELLQPGSSRPTSQLYFDDPYVDDVEGDCCISHILSPPGLKEKTCCL